MRIAHPAVERAGVQRRVRGGRAPSHTRPSTTGQAVRAAGEPNAEGPVLSTLRALVAAWISPPNTTTAPSPAAALDAGQRDASSRLAGPSAPGRLAGRLAPVSTIGASPP